MIKESLKFFATKIEFLNQNSNLNMSIFEKIEKKNNKGI